MDRDGGCYAFDGCFCLVELGCVFSFLSGHVFVFAYWVLSLPDFVLYISLGYTWVYLLCSMFTDMYVKLTEYMNVFSAFLITH